MKDKDNAFLIVLTIVFGILFSIVPVLRYFSNQPRLIGEHAYYAAGNVYFFSLFHILLNFLSGFFSVAASFYLISGIFGFLSILFFYLVLRIYFKPFQSFIISLFFIISSSFLYFITSVVDYLIVIVLILAGLYFLSKKRSFISIICFVLVPFFGLVPAVVLLITLLNLALFDEKKRDIALTSFIVSFAASLIYLYYVPSAISYLLYPTLVDNILSFFFDLNFLQGFSVFYIALGVIGIVSYWRNKRTFIYISGMLIILSILNSNFIIFLSPIICALAALGILDLYSFKWKLKIIRDLTLIILIIGIALSTISAYSLAVSSEPSNAVKESLSWLKDNSNPNDLIFSHISKGHWIQFFADRPAFTDLSQDYSSFISKQNISSTIFYSRDLKTTSNLLSKNDISFIWIDSTMRSGQVWSEEKEGLLFLFRNNETFRNIYSKDDIEIWQFIG